MEKCNADTDVAQIERLAFQLWEERGRPPGSPEEDWHRAEKRLRRQSQSLTSLLNRSRLPFGSIKMGY